MSELVGELCVYVRARVCVHACACVHVYAMFTICDVPKITI